MTVPPRLPPPDAPPVAIESVASELRTALASGAPRAARAVVRNGALRVTLVLLPPRGEMAEHTAPGPITVHLLRGDLRLLHADREEILGPGALLTLDAGVPHAVRSDGGAEFLLTLAV